MTLMNFWTVEGALQKRKETKTVDKIRGTKLDCKLENL